MCIRDSYQTVYWDRDRFAARLTAAGLRLDWERQWIGREGVRWASFLACRPRG